MQELETILHRIDGRGYKAYKDIQGKRFRFDEFELLVDHVQGDPYAAPSRLRVHVPHDIANLPASTAASPARRRATRDFLARSFRAAAGRHREIAIDAGRQTVLDRSACLIHSDSVELRFTVDLPGAGRRILGRKAATLLIEVLPEVVNRSALPHNLDLGALERHIAVVEDQEALRAELDSAGLVPPSHAAAESTTGRSPAPCPCVRHLPSKSSSRHPTPVGSRGWEFRAVSR